MTLKLVLITDIHVGPQKPYQGQNKKLSRRSLPLISDLVQKINTEIRPDFVVQLGDLIEDEDPNADRRNYMAALSSFQSLTMPVFHVVGNHEQVNLDYGQLASMLGYDKLHYSFDFGEFHFIVLFSTSRNHTDIHIDEKQRDWLSRDLRQTFKPTIVFVHHPLDEQDLTGSFWFAAYPDYCFVEERKEIRQLLSDSGKVAAVFNGHVHRNYLQTVDSIPYVTLQSLVENQASPDDPQEHCSESFAIVTLSPEALHVEVHGNDPAVYSVYATSAGSNP